MVAIASAVRAGIPTFDLLVEGDSIARSDGTATSSYGHALSWAWRAVKRFNPQPAIINRAVAGTNLTNMVDRIDTYLDDITSTVAAGRRAICMVQMGNGLIEKSPSEYYATFKMWMQEVRDAGGELVICELDHRNTSGVPGGGAAPGFETGVAVNAANVYFNSDPSLYKGIVKFTTFTEGQLAAVGTGIGDSLLYPDGIHPENGCYVLKTTRCMDVLNLVLSPLYPVNTVAPVITGSTVYPSTLSVSNGTWSPSPTFARQWYRTATDGHDVVRSGETSGTYAIHPLDIDKQLKANVGDATYGSWKASAYTSVITAAYGTETVSNGTFTSDTAGWTATGNTIASVGGRCRMTGTGASHGRFNQTSDISTNSGSYYRMTLDFMLGTNSPAARVLIQNTFGGTELARIDMTTSGSYAVVFQATGSTTYFDIRDPTDGGNPAPVGSTWEFDNVSVKRVTGT